MSAAPQISVVIPVKNGAATLHACLSAIRSQTLPVAEIIVLDSGSTDDSRAICAQHGVRVIPIPPQEFNHGLTRNIGVAAAQGDVIFFTVQDARLADETMLERMAVHFSDKEVMAVCGHQAVPHERDKNPVLWFRRYSIPVAKARQTTKEAYARMSQQEQVALIAWDNVVAMYRKQALLDLPFQQTNFAEDWIWSRDALLTGCKLIYDPSVVVYHYHHISFSYAYRVAFEVNYQMLRNFGFTPKQQASLLKIAKDVLLIMRLKQFSIREKMYWMKYNLLAYAGRAVSYMDFYLTHAFGGRQKLERRYQILCGLTPQGTQNNRRD